MNSAEINGILASVHTDQPAIFDNIFYEIAGDGMAIANYVHFGLVIPTEEGQEWIDEAWDDFCMYAGVDPDTKSMDDFMTDFLDKWGIKP